MDKRISVNYDSAAIELKNCQPGAGALTLSYALSGNLNAGHWVYLVLCEIEDQPYARLGWSVSPLAKLSRITRGIPRPQNIALVWTQGEGQARRVDSELSYALLPWKIDDHWFRFDYEQRLMIQTAMKAVFSGYLKAGIKMKWQSFSYSDLLTGARLLKHSHSFVRVALSC